VKILSVSFGYPSEAYRVKYLFTHEQAKAFKNHGVDIEVLDLSSESIKYNNEIFEDIKVHRFIKTGKNIPAILKNRKLIKKILISSGFDLVLLSFINYQYIAYFDLFKRYSLQLAFTAHGADAMSMYDNFIIKFIKRHMLKTIDYVYSVSEYTDTLVSVLQRRNIEDCYKSYVVYNGVNEQKLLKAKSTSREDCRKELGIEVNSFVVLAVCDLIERKGLDILINAIGILKNHISSIRIIIIGRGEEEDALKTQANTLGIEKNIEFISYIESDELLSKYFKASNVYSMISKTIYELHATEGFGISFVEASYLGVPVVAGNNGGSSTAVKHGLTGFLVDPYDKKCSVTISNYIKNLFEDKVLYEDMSSNAIQSTPRVFTWSNNVVKILETLKK